ncbi:hypothetical protein MycrhDRAFT_5714 [Mycolicibacterium rhodesiae JS60]|nr:hypothetical protein MycrhDRAFT_5714 [Mycolicibacterium rhodesiae JS60]
MPRCGESVNLAASAGPWVAERVGCSRHHGVVEGEFIEQPLAGFDYSYWFDCVACGARVNIAADLYERQTTYTPPGRPADFSRCEECGTEVDVTDVRPVLRNLNDIALQDDSVARLYWYHSSPYENWPDPQAYAAEFVARISKGPSHGAFTLQELLEQHTSRAVHIGTYEAAIENMLRRLHDQDRHDGAPARYWLHRVQIHLEPGDLASDVGEELADWMGNVPLSMLHERGGARAVRYVNTNEADGSVSVAIDPTAIATVATTEIPVESVAVETAAAAAATAKAVTALAEIAHLRPDTTGVDELPLRFRSALKRTFPDAADPERQRIEAIAEKLGAYNTQRVQIWALLKSALESEYLPEVNDQVRRRFHDALPHTDDPVHYHRSIRLLGALLARPGDVIAELAHAPVRTINNAGRQ